MVKYILAFFLLSGTACLANMASPLREGTHAISAVSSKDIAILNENIRIHIDKDFRQAHYKVVYTIQTESEGMQIPLLFHARDYLGKFRVWLDGKAVELTEIPSDLHDLPLRLNAFSSSFPKAPDGSKRNLLVRYDAHSGRFFPLSDFNYFEVDLSQGIHTISVEYISSVWVDHSDWLNTYSFRYFLSPAREWKSFRELNLEVDASDFKGTIHSNLGKPDSGSLNRVARWKFSGIPSDYILLSYHPQPNRLASVLIWIGPLGLTLLFALLTGFLHLFAIRFLVKRSRKVLASCLVVAGSLLIPFVILFAYCYSFYLIDDTIGKHAGGFHGYASLALFLYVLLMPAYWAGIYQIYKRYKTSFERKS